MTRRQRERLFERHPDLLVMDGFDDCIIGVVVRYTEEFFLYDLEKVLRKLQKRGCSLEEAEEYWAFNQVGAWVGESTPGFLLTEE